MCRCSQLWRSSGASATAGNRSRALGPAPASSRSKNLSSNSTRSASDIRSPYRSSCRFAWLPDLGSEAIRVGSFFGGIICYPPAMTLQPTESILIVDFGSQVTQLIARRIREAGVYSEIAPFNTADEAFKRLQPKGIILSGGPSSVMWDDSPRAPQHFFDRGLPILGICYGQQAMAHQLGGRVAPGENREFGRAFIEIIDDSALFDGLWSKGESHQVWMSHGDRVEQLPDGFKIVARSEGAPYAIATDESRRFYSTMFHPEVVHTPDGGKLLANFVRHVCGCAGDWTMASFKDAKIADIRDQVGKGRVICGLSGGVDSAVAAA